MNSGSDVLGLSDSYSFIFFQREVVHQNNQNPKATIVRRVEEKQDNATKRHIFSIV